VLGFQWWGVGVGVLTTGSSGLARVDVADDHDVDVKLLLTTTLVRLCSCSVVFRWMARPRRALRAGRTPSLRMCVFVFVLWVLLIDYREHNGHVQGYIPSFQSLFERCADKARRSVSKGKCWSLCSGRGTECALALAALAQNLIAR
jgi:hypothetical protein